MCVCVQLFVYSRICDVYIKMSVHDTSDPAKLNCVNTISYIKYKWYNTFLLGALC